LCSEVSSFLDADFADYAEFFSHGLTLIDTDFFTTDWGEFGL
jgi:hypothetical protein